MMSVADITVQTIIKEIQIVINDGLKYKRVYTLSSTNKNKEESEDIQWYSTTTDILEPTKDKEWKEMGYNDGSKIEKIYQTYLKTKS